MTTTTSTDLLDALREVCPPGRVPAVDTALARAEAVISEGRERTTEVYRAMLDTTAPTAHSIAGRLLAGEIDATEAVRLATMPVLSPEAEAALRGAVEQQVATAAREAIEAAEDALPETWADDVLQPLWRTWTVNAMRLSDLLDEHGVDADPAAVLEADNVVQRAWKATGAAARACLDAAAAVAEVEGDVEGGPTADGPVLRWWVPVGPTATARRDRLQSWYPSAHPVQLLPVVAEQHGVRLSFRGWVEAEITRRAWDRIEVRPVHVLDPSQPVVEPDDGLAAA